MTPWYYLWSNISTFDRQQFNSKPCSQSGLKPDTNSVRRFLAKLHRKTGFYSFKKKKKKKAAFACCLPLELSAHLSVELHLVSSTPILMTIIFTVPNGIQRVLVTGFSPFRLPWCNDLPPHKQHCISFFQFRASLKAFLLKKNCDLWTMSCNSAHTTSETLKCLTQLPTLMQSFWWWKCSD